MRVEDSVNRRGGLNLGPAFLSRRSLAGKLEPKSYFEMASSAIGIAVLTVNHQLQSAYADGTTRTLFIVPN